MADDFQQVNSLIQRICDGSQDAVRELLKRYERQLVTVIRERMVQKLWKKFGASDFLQEVWASFLGDPASGKTCKTPDELFALLATIARNAVAATIRQRLVFKKYNINREHSLDGSFAWVKTVVPDRGPTPSEAAGCEDQWQCLLEGRPQHQQRIMVMLREGHTHKEIADALDVNEKTVRRIVRRLSLGLSL